jgi:hypothetical protein
MRPGISCFLCNWFFQTSNEIIMFWFNEKHRALFTMDFCDCIFEGCNRCPLAVIIILLEVPSSNEIRCLIRGRCGLWFNPSTHQRHTSVPPGSLAAHTLELIESI